MIKNAQRLGLSLDEIASIIASDDGSNGIEPIARRKVAEIDAQIAQLKAIRDALAGWIE